MAYSEFALNNMMSSDRSDNEDLTVAICVATFKRPKGLTLLLESLQALNLERLQAHLIVVDNDPNATAKAAFSEMRDQLPFPATYIVEPTRGIVAARNRLVTEARNIGASFVAFADDDQTAEPFWLQALVQAAVAHDAAAVAPNLQYSFPPETSGAIRRCFAGPPKPRPTGSEVRSVGTNGSLYRLSALDMVQGPFDMRVNLSGGSDALLAAFLKSLGLKLISAQDSIITEHMPSSRLNFRWIAKRAWREGNCRAQEVKWVTPSRSKSIKWCALFAGFAAKNALMAIPDAIRHREPPLRRARLVIFGVSGLWHMIFGFSKYEEYAQAIHGS